MPFWCVDRHYYYPWSPPPPQCFFVFFQNAGNKILFWGSYITRRLCKFRLLLFYCFFSFLFFSFFIYIYFFNCCCFICFCECKLSSAFRAVVTKDRWDQKLFQTESATSLSLGEKINSLSVSPPPPPPPPPPHTHSPPSHHLAASQHRGKWNKLPPQLLREVERGNTVRVWNDSRDNSI